MMTNASMESHSKAHDIIASGFSTDDATTVDAPATIEDERSSTVAMNRMSKNTVFPKRSLAFDCASSTVRRSWLNAAKFACRLLLMVTVTASIVPLGLSTGETHEPSEEEDNKIKASDQPDPIPGRWRKFRKDSLFGDQKAESLTESQLETVRQLEALGYVDGMWPAPTVSGVTVNTSTRTWDGLNFFVSGHASEAILMDMEGNVIHTWSHEYPAEITNKRKVVWSTNWRRAHLFENGDILALWENLALARLDKNSRIIWTYFGNPHHDIYVTGDGKIYVLSAKPSVVPAIHETLKVMDHFIDVLDKSGNRIDRTSVLDSFRNSEYYWPLFESLREFVEYRLVADDKSPGDIFHSNTIQVLDGSQARKSPIFKKGNLLVCLREPGIVAVIDPNKKSVVWALSGMWRRQHDSTLLENGHMLIFDNMGNGGFSRILEIDPFTQNAFWKFEGAPPRKFYSANCGAVQRLPNGNTLITESNNGRAFEVTRDGTVVWEYVSPFRAGEDNDLIATLYDVVRISPDRVLDWLED